MINYSLTHPEILYALARNGHGAKILIADGNFPVETNTNIYATKVYLNLSPDFCKTTDVVKLLLKCIPVEKVITMTTDEIIDHPVLNEIESQTGKSISIEQLNKTAFYQHTESNLNCLTIVTGDTRRFANIILVVGVRQKTNE